MGGVWSGGPVPKKGKKKKRKKASKAPPLTALNTHGGRNTQDPGKPKDKTKCTKEKGVRSSKDCSFVAKVKRNKSQAMPSLWATPGTLRKRARRGDTKSIASASKKF